MSLNSPPALFIVKDESLDDDIADMRQSQMDDIDYTIIDSDLNPVNMTTQQRSPIITKMSKTKINKNIQKLKNENKEHMLIMSATGNSLSNFNHHSSSSPNQTTLSIKQQPFSPPAYHSLSNGYFPHHNNRRTTTPSPDKEQISPSSNNLTETSSASNSIPPSTTVTISPEEKRRCAVCNDIASGYHYGVWSCEGCKAFFKRSIQGTNEYICPATNTCTIDKHRRKSCQACRLRRCYEVGMTKGTTRRERKYRKKAVSVCKITSTSSNSNANNNSNNNSNINSNNNNNTIANNQDHTHLNTNNSSFPTQSSTASTCQVNNGFSSSQIQANKTASDNTRFPISSAEFISTLSQASRLNLPAKADTNRRLDDQYFLQLLAKIFDQELVVLINWAKAMPGYTESLTLDQQVTIIEQSWLDTLLLNVIERSLERNDDALHFAPDFVISRNRDLSSPCLGSICSNLFNILQAFKEPRTTHEEFITLKAAILVNSIPPNITTTKSSRQLTNQVYQSIQYACDSNPSVYHDNYIRYFTLLLQLPHIKMLSSKLIRLFLDMRTNDILPQADLLLEMLDAQDTFDIKHHFLSTNADSNNLTSHASNFTLNSAPPTVPNNAKVNYNYSTTNNYNQKQADNIDETNGQINFRPSSSPIVYSKTSPGKRSPTTPPLQYYKHSRTETISTAASTNIHFPMNNSSY